MVFSSLIFIFWFIPIFFALYYVVPSRFRNTILFIGSIVFYAWGEPKYLLLIFASILFNYLFGIGIDKSSTARMRRIILILAMVFDFGMLFIFKYLDFFINNINKMCGTQISLVGLALPLGISFYTFQIASYIIDLYKGEIEAEHNIITLGTYLVMFPQLIAGPIVMYKSVALELKTRKILPEMIEEGIGIFILGLASKIIIANQCGALFTELDAIGYANISMPLAWLGVIAYTLQIYFDFNGYSLMAVGLGKMLGFNLPPNFNYPYISKSVTEFWRRWHITLSTWFRDYLYIPLGGNRKGRVRTYINLFIVWFLTGFWHGAGWNFIFWGLFFFILLVIEKSFLLRFLENHRIIARAYTLLMIGLSWMMFGITDFGKLKIYFTRLFTFSYASDCIYYLRNYAVILIIGCIFSTPVIAEGFAKLKSRVLKLFIYVLLMIISVCYLADASFNPFLYFRF